MINAYVGINQKTGKPKRATRLGFETKKEADNFYNKKELMEFLTWCQNNLFFDDYTAFRLLMYARIKSSTLVRH